MTERERDISEVRRRKWLKDHLESSSNDDPVVFRSSIIPWWPWVKRFHLPEAELLNGIIYYLSYGSRGLFYLLLP